MNKFRWVWMKMNFHIIFVVVHFLRYHFPLSLPTPPSNKARRCCNLNNTRAIQSSRVILSFRRQWAEESWAFYSDDDEILGLRSTWVRLREKTVTRHISQIYMHIIRRRLDETRFSLHFPKLSKHKIEKQLKNIEKRSLTFSREVE